MPTVKSFFIQPTMTGKRLAAILDKRSKSLYYYDANAEQAIPPSVFVWSHAKAHSIGGHGKVMTSYGKDWSHTYTRTNPIYTSHADADSEYVEAKKVGPLDAQHWKAFNFDGLGTPPDLKGLYEAEASYGVSRARRVYLLAAFAKMKKYGLRTKAGTGGHNIGSLLTDDTGKVLSWGMNNGGFCHAEVNTILGYLARNNVTNLPAKSVLFTTLKPCLMCSRLIAAAQDSGSKVKAWYGMVDSGEKGGTKLLGDYSAPFKSEAIVTNLDFADEATDEAASRPEPVVRGTKPVNIGTGTTKKELSGELDAAEALRGQKSAADWVDQSDEIFRLIDATVGKLQRKVGKQRDDGSMKKVLDYLKGWALP